MAKRFNDRDLDLLRGEVTQCPELTKAGDRCRNFMWFDRFAARRSARPDWRCGVHRNGHVLTDAEGQQIIEAGTKPWELVRLANPGLSDEEARFVLWNHTPYPLVSGVHDLVDAVAELWTEGEWLV